MAKKLICSKLVCSSELSQWLHQKINRDLFFPFCNSLVIWSQRRGQGTSEIFKQEPMLPTCRLLHLCNVKWVWLENTADIQRQQVLVVTGAGWALGTVSRQAGVQLCLRQAGVRGCAVPLGTAIYRDRNVCYRCVTVKQNTAPAPGSVFSGEHGQCLGSGERSLPLPQSQAQFN